MCTHHVCNYLAHSNRRSRICHIEEEIGDKIDDTSKLMLSGHKNIRQWHEYATSNDGVSINRNKSITNVNRMMAQAMAREAANIAQAKAPISQPITQPTTQPTAKPLPKPLPLPLPLPKFDVTESKSKVHQSTAPSQCTSNTRQIQHIPPIPNVPQLNMAPNPPNYKCSKYCFCDNDGPCHHVVDQRKMQCGSYAPNHSSNTCCCHYKRHHPY